MTTCETCDTNVPEDGGHTETVPGYGGPETLVFCDDCRRAGR